MVHSCAHEEEIHISSSIARGCESEMQRVVCTLRDTGSKGQNLTKTTDYFKNVGLSEKLLPL